MKGMTPETEKIYTVGEIAEMLQISDTRVISIFADEAGTINLGTSTGTKQKRRFRQLRIPASVLTRVIARRTVRS